MRSQSPKGARHGRGFRGDPLDAPQQNGLVHAEHHRAAAGNDIPTTYPRALVVGYRRTMSISHRTLTLIYLHVTKLPGVALPGGWPWPPTAAATAPTAQPGDLGPRAPGPTRSRQPQTLRILHCTARPRFFSRRCFCTSATLSISARSALYSFRPIDSRPPHNSRNLATFHLPLGSELGLESIIDRVRVSRDRQG